ncbi:unnamed protein product [Candida parapsilosis]
MSNFRRTFDLALTTSLEQVDFSRSGLKKAPGAINYLPKLRILNLAGNKISRVDIKLSSSIEHLDLSRNELKDFSLHFCINGESSPRVLDLSCNQLREIISKSLGFESNRVHKDMYKIGYSDNSNIIIQPDLSSLLSHSLHFWWFLNEGLSLQIAHKAQLSKGNFATEIFLMTPRRLSTTCYS